MVSDDITIRSIQHYLYCPHRWGLLEIERAWAENVFVTKANLVHERVHAPDSYYIRRGRKVCTSVPLYYDEPYNLYGVADCLEFTPSKNGVIIDESGQRYQVGIVEYKPTKPKDRDYRDDDLLQVFAQKLCVDFIFGSDCIGEIYYADVRKRVSLPLILNYDLYDQQLRDCLNQMREWLREGKVPPIPRGQKCSGCSMKDLCMPASKKIDFREELKRIGESDI